MIPLTVPLGLKLLAKSPVTLRKTLSKEDGVVSQKNGMEQLLNASGVVLTDLRPAGSIKINNKKIDAVTQGEYIDKGTFVHVIQVTGNQIIVKEK